VTITVFSPVPDFDGRVLDVYFVDGRAAVEASNDVALGYFRRHGYGIGEQPAEPWAPSSPPPGQPRSEMVRTADWGDVPIDWDVDGDGFVA
jgi:hypothetical protein